MNGRVARTMAPARAIGNQPEVANCSLGMGDVRRRRRGLGGMGVEMTTGTDELAMRVWFRLIRLEARMQVAITERLREIGLSAPQCDVLTTLTEAEGVSQQELAKRLYVTKGNISGLLDRLETDGPRRAPLDRDAIGGNTRSI